MSNTTVDKFAECPYYTCVTKDNNKYGSGEGRWHDKSGKGILDNKDGSGFAKGFTSDANGYTSYANNSPSHVFFDRIKR